MCRFQYFFFHSKFLLTYNNRIFFDFSLNTSLSSFPFCLPFLITYNKKKKKRIH
ncbi:hypothetical protein Hanom_Chr00s001325g01680171 [Helianthus anomalus]